MLDLDEFDRQPATKILILDQRQSKVLLAVLLNLAAIISNVVTFWFASMHLPPAMLMATTITNNVASGIGILIAALSLLTGWSYVHDLANRLSFSLLCGLTMAVSVLTFS